MFRNRTLFVMAAALGLAALTSFATAEPLKLDVVRSQQTEIRKGVESRIGIYKEMSERDREVLLARQASMLRLIEGKQTANDLNEEQRTNVFNTLELIEALVNKADDERLVCERRATLGSNRIQRVCMTVAQMREARERSREDLNRGQDQIRR